MKPSRVITENLSKALLKASSQELTEEDFGELQILQKLCSSGIKVNEEYIRDIRKYISHYGADSNFNEELFIKALEQLDKVFKVKDLDFLHVAIFYGNYRVADILMKFGYDLFKSNNKGHTHFHQLILNTLNKKNNYKIVAFLNKHTDFNDPKTWKDVSLYTICLGGNWELAKFIISLKTDPNECDDMGFSALDALMEFRSNADKYTGFNGIDWKNIHEISEQLLKRSQLKYIDNVPDLPEIQMLTKMIKDPELRNLQKTFIKMHSNYETIYKNALAKLPNATKLEEALCPKTIAQHKNVIWSLSNRHRARYFQRMLASPKTKKVTIQFENIKDITLNFIDLRKKTSYNFMVHTTSGLPKILEKTLESGAGFIQTTAFFSCSLIDKNTGIAAMDHQDSNVPSNNIQRKVLFPISLILDLADDAVLQAFPVDAWSPMLTTCTDKDKLTRVSEDYISFLKRMKEHFNTLETMVLQGLTQPVGALSTSLPTLDLDQMFKILSKDRNFKMPDSRIAGWMPQLTPKQVLKQTRFGFNEVIVAGKPKNKVLGILVEQSSLDMFNERLSKLQADELKQVQESLSILSRSKYPLVLVDTRVNGFKNKIAISEHFMNVFAEFQTDAPTINKELLRHYRLTKSRQAVTPADEISRMNERLKRHTKKLKTTYKKLDDIKKQFTGKRI